MRVLRSVFMLALLLQAVLISALPSDTALATNAEGGTFPSGRSYWFSVSPRERLRLVLDGVELYRGAGPAVAELPAAEGEERRYELIAERLRPAPDDGLIESRSFLVVVDAVPPAPPTLSARKGPQDGWALSVSVEPRARVDAVVAADGVLSVRRGLVDGATFVARSLAILAWAVDPAGNSSKVTAFDGVPLELEVANPATGRWANRQRLVVFSEGAEEVLWTDDGSDPRGSSGRAYEGPILIDAAGEVLVRVAARSRDGRLERREVTYSVVEAGDESLATLRAAEETPFAAEAILPIPAGYRWDSASSHPSGATDSGELRYEESTLILRPVQHFIRAYALLIGDRGLPRRFAFTLDGRTAASGGPLSEGGAAMAEAANDDEGTATEAGAAGPVPILHAAGMARALVWPQTSRRIRYRIGAERPWLDAASPVPLPASAVKVEWIEEGDALSRGPFTEEIGAAEGFSEGPEPAASRPEGTVAAAPVRLSSVERETARFYLTLPGSNASPPISLTSSKELVLDVCDGEALVWSARPESGGEGRSWAVDRAPPRSPRIEGPAEGASISRAVEVTVAGEEKIQAVVHRQRPSLQVDTFDLVGSTKIEPSREEIETIRIEAKSVDEAGNESPTVLREFTMDATTVYAGSDRRHPEVASDGSRDQPFASLDAAIATAKAKGLKQIRVLSDVTLLGSVKLSEGMRVEGGYRPDGSAFGGQSRVTVAPGALLVAEGAAVTLSSLLIEGGADSSGPLIHAEGGARVKVVGCDLIGGALGIDAASASLELTECRLVAAGVGASRAYAIRTVDSAVSLDRCRLEVSTAAAVATALDCRGGKLTLRTMVADVHSRLSAFGLVLRNTTLNAEGAETSVVAEDYASGLDAGLSSFKWKGGSLNATARDVALVTLDDCVGSFSAASFNVSAASSVRAFRVRGGFPSIVGSFLSSAPSARSADVFSGTEPGPGSVAGNRFRGFGGLWDQHYGAEDIAAFNRRYAPRDAANIVVDAEDGE